MKRNYFLYGKWGGISILLWLLLAAGCQKSNELSKQNNVKEFTSADDESVAAGKCLYYLSPSQGKLFVTEKSIDLCKADLGVKILSNNLWQINFPLKTTVKVYLIRAESYTPLEKPNMNDLRVRPNYTCEGIVAAVDTCANSGSRSYHIKTSGYKECILKANATCQDAYIKVGLGKAYSGPDCTGQVIGSYAIYKWVCGPL